MISVASTLTNDLFKSTAGGRSLYLARGWGRRRSSCLLAAGEGERSQPHGPFRDGKKYPFLYLMFGLVYPEPQSRDGSSEDQ